MATNLISGVSGGRERHPSSGMHRVDSTTDLSTYEGCGEGGSTKLQVRRAQDAMPISLGSGLGNMLSRNVTPIDTHLTTTGHHKLWPPRHKLSPGGCGVRADGVLPVAPLGSGYSGLFAGTPFHGHRWNPYVGHSCLRLLCHLSGRLCLGFCCKSHFI